ncbi:MAG: DUF309 domain-containing protein [Melioribacteraceae bacterium]
MIDISEGVLLFNDCDFFAAHDFFEEVWMSAIKSEKEFFQGLVQISVGSFHLICGNKNGAKSQLTKGKFKLEQYLPSFYNVNIIKLVSELSILVEKIEVKDIFNLIPKIELTT